MPTHIFTLIVDRLPDDDEVSTLTHTRCADAVFGTEGNLTVAEFDREADTLADAVASAIRDVESVGLRVLRVLDPDLVTLADIADRVGRSRESIRRYTTGQRGVGGFPLPVNPGREGTVFYRWSEVGPWLRDHASVDIEPQDSALVVADLLLQARQHRNRVAHYSVLIDLLTSERFTDEHR